MNTRTTIVVLCVGIWNVVSVQAAPISLDDVPWLTVKNVALGDNRDSYAKLFGAKYSPMSLGSIELWPNTLSDNEMCAACFREDKIAGVLWTWKRLSPERTRALTFSIFQYLNEQDKKPLHIPSQKIVGERIANVLTLSFGMPGKGPNIRALFTSSDVETTVIIHDGTAPEFEGVIAKSGKASLLKEDEEPIPVVDYLNEEVLSNQRNLDASSAKSIPARPPGLPTPKVTPSTMQRKTPEAKPAAASEEPKLLSPWSTIVVLLVALLGLLRLLRKRPS